MSFVEQTAAGLARLAQGLLTLALRVGVSAAQNCLINGGFTVNQRGVSGTVSLSAGQYGHDGWKAGSAGCTYTFAASGGITTVTISAGTLMQVIPAARVTAGANIATWAGTAQGRIGSGSYSGSGIVVTLPAASTSVEFGVGTLSLAQLRPGSVSAPFAHRDDELIRCLPFCQLVHVGYSDVQQTTSVRYVVVGFGVPMHSTPSAPTLSASTQIDGDSNVASLALSSPTPRGARINVTPTASGGVFVHRLVRFEVNL